MAKYSDKILHSKIAEITVEEVKKFNIEKGQNLEAVSRWPDPDTNVPYYVSVIRKKDKLTIFGRLVRHIYPLSAYNTLIDVYLAPFASDSFLGVILRNLEYNDLAKRIEDRLVSLKPFQI